MQTTSALRRPEVNKCRPQRRVQANFPLIARKLPNGPRCRSLPAGLDRIALLQLLDREGFAC
eukprot:3563468-Amphidinium_carterae.1